ncbi:hypothetical protein [Shewanella baltica]|uniref:hypothetical protein n=1 Tax=Shewanella baltica TaxID=62322 RepID=UPI00325DD52B
MKLHHLCPLLMLACPLLFAGQTLSTLKATQTQICSVKLATSTRSVRVDNTPPAIKDCLKAVNSAESITINCPASGNLTIDGIDKTKQNNDFYAAQMLAECVKQSAQVNILSNADEMLLKQLGETTSTQQIKATFQDRWISSFELGYKQQNGYNEIGERTGFDQGGVTGSFKLNGRWQARNKLPVISAIANFEIGVIFGKNPTVNDNIPESNEAKFNDVTDSIDGYIKGLYSPSWDFMRSDDGDSVLSFAALGGLRSLDETTQGNELARYYGGGLEFNLYSEGILINQNALPRARVSSFYIRTTDYGSLQDIGLWRIQAQFQLVKDKPFLIGFEANLGPDDLDDYSVTISVRQSTDSLLKFFGFITES